MAEGVTTLADTLLDDLDDLSDNDNNGVEEEEEEENVKIRTTTDSDNTMLPKDAIEGNNTDSPNDNIYSPSSDSALQKHLKCIRQFPERNDLITRTNQFLRILRQALEEAHLELISAYEPKFPELADLLTDPFLYQQTVLEIGCTEMDIANVTPKLETFLTANQIITISVAGSTTSGRPLQEGREQETLYHVASIISSIREHQNELRNFVRLRMKHWAPNTSALLGEDLAAQLIAGCATGNGENGLQELSKIPSCNLQVMGQSNNKSHQDSALLYQSDLVQSCPSKFKRKAVKVVAAKLALTIRCDLAATNKKIKSSAAGEGFRNQIQEKLQQWQTPDKAPILKALPKPDLTTKKRRGGKRMRRIKERFEETELMKQANTRAFSTQAGEYGDDAMGLTLGMLDAETNDGKIRKNASRSIKKMRHANTKASRKREQQQQQHAARARAAASSGLASSMVFTPVQGMELIDPTRQQEEQKKRVAAANRQWFATNAGFQSALPKDT